MLIRFDRLETRPAAGANAKMVTNGLTLGRLELTDTPSIEAKLRETGLGPIARELIQHDFPSGSPCRRRTCSCLSIHCREQPMISATSRWVIPST